jgi:hypothetical protein
MAGLYSVQVHDSSLRVMLNTAKLNLNPAQVLRMGEAVRDLSANVQARAVRNVSGYPVQYEGGVFRVKSQTGALKGAIEQQWPYQSPLQARVFVNGAMSGAAIQIAGALVKPRPVSDYAGAIESGHGEIDLKKTMMGKTVPFFAARSQNATGPYAGRGLRPEGSGWVDDALNHKLSSKGAKGPMSFKRHKIKGGTRGAGSYYVTFRKVGKTGWIIPAAKPRPFMRAAGTGQATQADARSLTAAKLKEVLRDAAVAPPHAA